MLSLLVGYCPPLVKTINDAAGDSLRLEIYESVDGLLRRISDAEMPPADVLFVDVGRMDAAGARAAFAEARRASAPPVAIAFSADAPPEGVDADFSLQIPRDLHRIPDIFSESFSVSRSAAAHQGLERRLAAAQLKMQTILDELSEGVAVIDDAGRITRVNRRLIDIYGTPDAGGFLGRHCYKALWGLAEPCAGCPVFVGADSLEDTRSLAIGENELVLDVCASRFSDDAAASGGVELIRDATPRLRQEKTMLESEKMKAVGVMAAGLAHELRNPIAIISSIAEYCLEIQHDEELEGGLESILNASRQAEKIVRELLNFSRPSPNRFGPVCPNELLQITASLVEARSRERDVELCVKLPDDLPTIHADESKLQQALLNFMLNAIDAMTDGGRLTVSAEAASDSALQIQIADTGCGIPEDELARIFEPFFTTKRSGVGLGLANAQRVIEAHRGRIDVESTHGKGTTITVVLPVAAQTQDTVAETA